jgi:hypothetical protein
MLFYEDDRTTPQYTQHKLVFENIIFQFIDNEYNGDRIFCLDEDMSIIVFAK